MSLPRQDLLFRIKVSNRLKYFYKWQFLCFILNFINDLPIFLESQTCKKMGQNEEIRNMSELKSRITENGIDYILVGDYYIQNLKLPEEHRPIGKYGRMHREYLREVHQSD